MSRDPSVYDLGAVDDIAPGSAEATYKPPVFAPRNEETVAPAHRLIDAIADSLGLFVPGAGQLVRGHWSDGLFVLSSTTFLLTLGWAIWTSLERLPGTLSALGWVPHGGLYALGMIYVGLAWIHAGNLLYSTSRGPARTAPVVAGCASALMPGWGQLLNRQPLKASLIVAGLWVTGLTWLLGSSWVSNLFASQGVTLRWGVELFSSPAIMWTAPIVLWALAVLDAASTAARR